MLSRWRNPRIFSGRYITVTRWADGSYHPNFRPMPMREDLTLERYALGVYNELCMALGGLVEEEREFLTVLQSYNSKKGVYISLL